MRSLLLWLSLAVPAWAVEPVAKIDAPASVPAGWPIMLDALGSTCEPGSPVVWKLVDGPRNTITVYDQADALGVLAVIRDPAPGRYRIRIYCYGYLDKPFKIGDKTFDVTPMVSTAEAVIDVGAIPQPTPPTPTPTPSPNPKPPTPQPTTELEAMGLTYGRMLISTYAQTLDESVAMVAAGQAVSLVTPDFTARWQARREQAFEPIKKAYNKIAPEGYEPTAEQRSAIIAAWQQVSRGLRLSASP